MGEISLFVIMSTAEKPLVPAPQEDFYHHVNKRWIEDPANTIPPEYSTWGGFVVLHDESLKNQISLLQEIQSKSKEQRSIDEHKLALIWDASITTYKEWEEETPQESTSKLKYQAVTSELAILSQFLQDNETDRLKRLAKYFAYAQRCGITVPFDIDKGSDLTQSMDIILDISPSGLSLPSRDYYFDPQFENQRNLFKDHLSNIVKIFNDIGVELTEDFESKVYSFEKDLAMIRMKSSQSRDYAEYYTNIDLDSFPREIDSLNFLAEKLENYSEDERTIQKYSEEEKEKLANFMNEIYSELDLRRVMRENFKKNYPDTEASEERLYRFAVYDGDYFPRLFRILFDEKNDDRILAYFQYIVIKYGRSYCTKLLDEEFFDFYSRKLTGQSEQKPMEKRSISRINSWVGELLGIIYVEKFFPPTSKIEVEGMIDTILGVMKVSLENNDWLTSSTKEKALEKLQKFTKKIGFPDKWKDYSKLELNDNDSLYEIRKKILTFTFEVDFLDEINSVKDLTKWYMTPQTVNAYFHPLNNEVVFPAAILQPPFFMSSVDQIDFEVVSTKGNSLLAANLGGIGAVIAHEITHGFDDQGRKFDGDGNLVDWWTEQDTELFKSKTNIMAAQAEQYEYVVTDEDGNTTSHKMQAKLTMGENLADLGGLSLTKKALLKYLEGEDKEFIDGSLDTFFRSWANIWKFKAATETRIKRLATDPHAPAEFRGNLVNNFDEFYSIFQVKEGDRMFIPPEKRVVMW